MLSIGNIIGSAIGSGISGLIAILIYYRTMKEAYKERLQERKGIWLEKHFQQLSNGLNDLAAFNVPQEGERKVQVLEGYQKYLETELVSYHSRDAEIVAEMKLKEILSEIKSKNIEHSTSAPGIVLFHMLTGYDEEYNNMLKLLEKANRYAEDLSNLLNSISERLVILMKECLPNLEPSWGNQGGSNVYGIVSTINTLIYNVIKGDENVEYDELKKEIVLKSAGYEAITFSDRSDYDKFLKRVWRVLINEFKSQIKSLLERRNNLSNIEKEFSDSIKQIISDYDAGYSIKGCCKICKKIRYEKDIKNLRPKAQCAGNGR